MANNSQNSQINNNNGINQNMSPNQALLTMNSVRSSAGLNQNKYRIPGIGHEQFFISTT